MLFSSLIFNISSCVQESYVRHIKVTLDVSGLKEISKVGVRGNGDPLSWAEDYPMQELVKDSLYTAVITTKTGYKFGECKFTVNGDFELKDRENRRVYFGESDTTYYHAVFGIAE
jgi:putative oxidoreductase